MSTRPIMHHVVMHRREFVRHFHRSRHRTLRAANSSMCGYKRYSRPNRLATGGHNWITDVVGPAEAIGDREPGDGIQPLYGGKQRCARILAVGNRYGHNTIPTACTLIRKLRPVPMVGLAGPHR
jgi:hypothetical protein